MAHDLIPPKQPGFLFDFVTEAPLWQQALVLVPLGFLAGHFVWWWIERLSFDLGFRAPIPCRRCEIPLSLRSRLAARCSACGFHYDPARLLTVLSTVGCFVLLAWAYREKAQGLPDGGSIDWFHYRLPVQLVLVTLLIAATLIDLRLFIIPDEITASGVLIGLLSAFIIGNLQFVPVWLDWNDPMVKLHGPAVPQWIREHHHWHGLVVSLAGLVVGAGLICLVRLVSAWVLQMEAMGFGDVTLMAMIGSFLGWQPVVFVFMLAPLCGLIIGLATWLVFRKTEMPYGPYLSAATLIVLCCWGPLWQNYKWLFSDGQALLVLLGVMTCALIVMLGLIRLYRLIPATARQK